jgi:hypothetical protein
MAFGELSEGLTKELGETVLYTVSKNCVFSGKESDDALTRKAAVKSLISIVKTVGVENIEANLLNEILEAFY